MGGRAVWIAIALFFAAAAGAQTYPQKPVRVIVPYPPGGTVDLVARHLGQQLASQVGQQIVVENRAGANGTIGSDFVSKAAPDGYTLLVQASIFVINPLFLKNVPYDVQRDFAPISNIGSVPLLVTAHPSVPAGSLREFVTLVRANPNMYTFATTGLGSAGHLTEEVIRREAGLLILIVPYKGTGPAITDLVGGQVSALADPLPSSYPHVKGGRLKALAVTSRERIAFLPEVPTMDESGFAGFEMVSWYGLWGPPALPREIVDRLAAEVSKAVKSPELQEKLAAQGFLPKGSTAPEFAAYVKDEIAKYAKIVKDANIKVD
ncbi:MAG TPA: tripartite tricarboxylate transporter substrate binding protein [Burkholderiales bacterium]|nr:tripartite tricarboxylate transporter substrate binding protein [Burkholderiales bacterium]